MSDNINKKRIDILWKRTDVLLHTGKLTKIHGGHVGAILTGNFPFAFLLENSDVPRTKILIRETSKW